MQTHANVLVFGEVDGDRLSASTLELLAAGGRLAADLRQDLVLVHLGAEAMPALEQAYEYGAQDVYAATDALLGVYQPDLFLQAMEQVVALLQPHVILFAQTDKGADLAPRLAFRLRTGVTLDCVDLNMDEATGLVQQVKPVFGGKALATYRSRALPQIASLRQGCFVPAPRAGRAGDSTAAVVRVDLTLDPTRARTRLVAKSEDETLSMALELASASVVVSGGRGIGDREGAGLITKTAGLLQGAVGATRAAVDEGLLPRSVLVGLTGRRVAPQLYMAVGLSGSLHHMAGCMRSRTIVAVNSDESASIFMFAHIGVVGDFRQVLQGFNEEIAAIKGGG